MSAFTGSGPASDVAVAIPGVYPVSPTTHYDKVEGFSIDDGTYVHYTGLGNAEDIYSIGDLSAVIPDGSTINSVNLFVRGKCSNPVTAQYFKGIIAVSNGSTWTNYYTSAFTDTAWTTHTLALNYATNPLTGLAWTRSEILTRLRIGCVCCGAAKGGQGACSALGVNIEYTSAGVPMHVRVVLMG